ncbi:MAG TPA: radical SAM protein [Candidatus Baltobacteraceae bacterium]|jgi:pyruvate-formate lyase-activating enzyme|nr:radical SAM protein [Candidatus Baltobacteraceae bacterium]
MIGLAYCDKAGRIFFDPHREPLADGGIVRRVQAGELIPAPPGTVPMVLPERRPMLVNGRALRRYALAVMLPAGYTRLLLPAYERKAQAPTLPLFGYCFACVVNDELYVAAMRTDESEDWQPRSFGQGELEAIIDQRIAVDKDNRVLRQVGLCSRQYGCFTAQNVFLERGEAALPVSPKCNARCVGCISEQEPEAGLPSPQLRIAFETSAEELARVAVHHLRRVPEGIVSFGQGCEGEPLLRSITIARAIELVRAQCDNGTVNMNTNGSMPQELERCIDSGLQAVRISLNSFRPSVYAAYYRPQGYGLAQVFDSIRLARGAGLRVSLNLLTHPGVTDDEQEVQAMRDFLHDVPVDMIQTRTLNIDPEWYFSTVGRPAHPIGMQTAITAMREAGARVGNFTHTH